MYYRLSRVPKIDNTDFGKPGIRFPAKYAYWNSRIKFQKSIVRVE